MKRDYYEVLQVSRQADGSEIKRSYRKLALEYHPDRNDTPEAEALFKEASEAYEVLSDQQKKQIYDQYGHQGLQSGGMHSGFSNMDDIFSSFGDVFEDFFGFGGAKRGGKRGQARRGADLRYDLTIDFMDAYHGCEKEISLTREDACSDCNGKGYPKDTKPRPCVACGGSGQVVRSQGFFAIATPCDRCRGAGEVIDKACDECRGNGVVRVNKKIKVKVPAGVDTNMRLRLSGEGNGAAAGPGDLYVFIVVKEHDVFKRQEDHIHLYQEISLVQAALGGDLTVPLPEGSETLNIPAGINTGEVLKIAGKGMKRVNGKGQGDLLVTIICRTPQNLSKEQLDLLEKLAALEPSDESKFKAAKKKKGFFGV